MQQILKMNQSSSYTNLINKQNLSINDVIRTFSPIHGSEMNLPWKSMDSPIDSNILANNSEYNIISNVLKPQTLSKDLSDINCMDLKDMNVYFDPNSSNNLDLNTNNNNNLNFYEVSRLLQNSSDPTDDISKLQSIFDSAWTNPNNFSSHESLCNFMTSVYMDTEKGSMNKDDGINIISQNELNDNLLSINQTASLYDQNNPLIHQLSSENFVSQPSIQPFPSDGLENHSFQDNGLSKDAYLDYQQETQQATSFLSNLNYQNDPSSDQQPLKSYTLLENTQYANEKSARDALLSSYQDANISLSNNHPLNNNSLFVSNESFSDYNNGSNEGDGFIYNKQFNKNRNVLNDNSSNNIIRNTNKTNSTGHPSIKFIRQDPNSKSLFQNNLQVSANNLSIYNNNNSNNFDDNKDILIHDKNDFTNKNSFNNLQNNNDPNNDASMHFQNTAQSYQNFFWKPDESKTVWNGKRNGQDDKKFYSTSTRIGNSIKKLANKHLALDLSKRPNSVNDAICKYMDFLIVENEVKTCVSSCSTGVQLPFVGFEKERYFHEVMCKPISFPTAKFRDWLNHFEIGIEITDIDGLTASQTTFLPPANQNSYITPLNSQQNEEDQVSEVKKETSDQAIRARGRPKKSWSGFLPGDTDHSSSSSPHFNESSIEQKTNFSSSNYFSSNSSNTLIRPPHRNNQFSTHNTSIQVMKKEKNENVIIKVIAPPKIPYRLNFEKLSNIRNATSLSSNSVTKSTSTASTSKTAIKTSLSSPAPLSFPTTTSTSNDSNVIPKTKNTLQNNATKTLSKTLEGNIEQKSKNSSTNHDTNTENSDNAKVLKIEGSESLKVLKVLKPVCVDLSYFKKKSNKNNDHTTDNEERNEKRAGKKKAFNANLDDASEIPAKVSKPQS